jgi:hypothetical protein
MANIPVILFSAFPKVFLSLGDYGCDLFVAKPFDVWDFLQQLSDLLMPGSIGPCPALNALAKDLAHQNNYRNYNKQTSNAIN